MTGRRIAVGSAIALVAAGAAAGLAVAVWPHGHGRAVPSAAAHSSNPAPSAAASTPASKPSKPKVTPTATPSIATGTQAATAPAQNLTIPSAVRQQLLAAFIAAKQVQPSEITGPRPGTVYYGYLPSTDTYWATADFALSPTAKFQTMVDFQDGGSHATFHHRSGQPWQVKITNWPWPCPGDVPNEMLSVWSMSILDSCSTVGAIAPNRGSLDSLVALPDGSYYGSINEIGDTYGGDAEFMFNPYTWSAGGSPVDNQPSTWSSLNVDPRVATSYADGTQAGVTEGVFDTAFAQRVASDMPQFAGHPLDGYIVTVQGQKVTSVTQIDALNPMSASHPSYTEPTG